jgi:hypothetical protein
MSPLIHPRRQWLVLFGAVVLVGTVGVTMAQARSADHAPTVATGPGATSNTMWKPTPAQVAASSHSLMALATLDDPDLSAAEASHAASSATNWPANVTKVEVQGTDRKHALALMGTSDATSGDTTNSVLLYQVTGRITDASFPKPSGAPIVTFTDCLFVVDVATGRGLDFGFVNAPITLDTAAVLVLK